MYSDFCSRLLETIYKKHDARHKNLSTAIKKNMPLGSFCAFTNNIFLENLKNRSFILGL